MIYRVLQICLFSSIDQTQLIFSRPAGAPVSQEKTFCGFAAVADSTLG